MASPERAGPEEIERDALAQAMWEARAILGFDNDGDKSPAAQIAGMGWEGFRNSFLDDMRQQRRDYDEALEEIPEFDARVALPEAQELAQVWETRAGELEKGLRDIRNLFVVDRWWRGNRAEYVKRLIEKTLGDRNGF